MLQIKYLIFVGFGFNPKLVMGGLIVLTSFIKNIQLWWMMEPYHIKNDLLWYGKIDCVMNIWQKLKNETLVKDIELSYMRIFYGCHDKSLEANTKRVVICVSQVDHAKAYESLSHAVVHNQHQPQLKYSFHNKLCHVI